jgi:transposase
MPATHIKPYVKRGKTDARDAEAICEAVTRQIMRFVPIQWIEQQVALALHRTRDLLAGLLAELAIDIPKGIRHALAKYRGASPRRLTPGLRRAPPSKARASRQLRAPCCKHPLTHSSPA